ncbi:MAG: TlpA disulfide reductase family protein [Ginsengibacter sp.]
MKPIFIVLLGLPLFALSQKKATTKIKSTPVTEQPTGNNFTITGTVTGFADGTSVSFLNEQTGEPENQATIQKGKFVIKGKMEQPAFKGLIFGNTQPMVPLFLDNSNITLTGDKNALDKLVIKGSPSNAQFSEYMNALNPYAKIFMPDAEYDTSAINTVKKISENFVRKYPSSYVSPLAIIRLYQVSEDGVKAEELYKLLPQQIKETSLGSYVNQQILESKINPIGSVISEFSQADPEGKPVSISSFRGKYVLVDFWASWCRPCRMENPNVVAAYNKFKDKKFTVLGVSLDQAKEAWINAIKMDNLAWNHVSDLKGWSNAVAAQFQVRSIPQNFLINPEGRIIAKNLRGAVLEKKLDALLK